MTIYESNDKPSSPAKQTGIDDLPIPPDPFWLPFDRDKLRPTLDGPPPTPEPLAETDEKTDRAALLSAVSTAALLARQFPPEEALLGSVITHTSRTFIIGATGTGKTNFGLALAGGMASGQGFGLWRSARPARVLFIDGEMPIKLLRQRVEDLSRRIGGEDPLAQLFAVSWQDASTLPLNPPAQWEPLNTPQGQQFIMRLCELVKPDAIMFDNVQCLITGDMKDELGWSETLPLVKALTSRNIGQIWIDHTGWNTTRQYGSSTKAWQFDTVGILEPLPPADQRPGVLGFRMHFDAPGKARRRTPDNWAEFAPAIVRLQDDRWTVEPMEGSAPAAGGLGRIKPSVERFHSALLDAISLGSLPGETTRAVWRSECVRRGLICAAEDGDTRSQRDRKTGKLRVAQSDLLSARWIGIDGERVMNLKR
jgi:hypothetical protein